MPAVSVIMAAYNVEPYLTAAMQSVMRQTFRDLELIVIDDGSNDGTLEILQTKKIAVKHLYLSPVNIGKGAAIRIGLSFAGGDIILLQDADLELDPNEYENLLRPIFDERASVVYGSRFLKPNKNVSFLRRAANHFLTATTNVLYNSRLTDMETAYKVFTADVVKNISLKSNRFDIEPEITARICQAGYKIYEIPISYSPRTASEGKKIKWQDGVKAFLTLFRCRLNKPPTLQKEENERI